ncbi:IucA/IucC family protein, partial [Staphylococcus arlettae]
MMPNNEQLVQQRIMNQLVTSLIYENIVHYQVSQNDQKETVIIAAGGATYHVTVHEAFSFQRLTLQSPVLRCNANGKQEATVNYAQLLREVEYTFPKNTTKIEAFIQELLQTELKDRQALQYKEASEGDVTLTFDALESYASEGHPYHPSYKSRLGFTLEDNLRYGPDFKPEFNVKWLAIPHQHI